MNWLRKFMEGRYGGDQLTVGLLILAILMTLLGQLLRLPIIDILGYLPLVWALFRMLSRNKLQRSKENYKFMMVLSPVYSRYRVIRDRLRDKEHRYYRCPKCGASLRVPKGKGRIAITCPKCKTEFIKKT